MQNKLLVAIVLVASILAVGPVAQAGTWPATPDHNVTLAMAPPGPAARTVVVPAQTEAKIELLSGIHSQVSHEGDLVTAQLVQPIYVGGEVALPAGSLLEGRITRVKQAGRMRRSAEMVLRFESITLPSGQDHPLSAILTYLKPSPSAKTYVDSEGFLKGTRVTPWKRIAAGFAGLGALGVIEGQLAGAAALGASLPIGGGALLGYAFLWPKGNEVHVPPDSTMRIRLRDSLTVRLPW